MNALPPAILIAATLALACGEDLRSRRIPNAVSVACLAGGLLWHAIGPAGAWAFDPRAPGAVGLAGAAAAFAGVLLALLPLRALGAMGGGDVKLLAAIAACLGASSGHWIHLPGLLLTVFVVGGGLSLARMLAAGTSRAVLANLRALVSGLAVRGAGGVAVSFDPRRDSADRMPYSLAIAAGTLLYLAGTWIGLLRTP
ncbi:MAG: hypothetical protein RJA99_4845 [Pseudomonadota bacterium]|jgi:prepilin peptidase CpaA